MRSAAKNLPQGRGGSVSRRDHNQLARNAPHLAGATTVKQKESTQSPATLRERGTGGEALLLEKRPLPQESPRRPCLRLPCFCAMVGGLGGAYVSRFDKGEHCARALLLFALPMIAGNMLQQLYNIADTLIVGRVAGQRTRWRRSASAYAVMAFLTSVVLGLQHGFAGRCFRCSTGARATRASR